MERLRRSLRLRKRPDRDRHISPDVTSGSKTEKWQPDEAAVRSGTCCFSVKYLGAVEVYESRGMQVCEGALRSLKMSRRKPVKAILYVSGDGLRVVDKGNSHGLLVDQTIEKVSFCAPDRMAEKGFAYICRDGASRRWMCHGFLATKETGERLSHAVGCAFSICLEKKKKRDNDVETSGDITPTVSRMPDIFSPNWDDTPTELDHVTAHRANLAYQSFRKHVSIEERYLDPQSVIVNEIPAPSRPNSVTSIAKPRPVANPALFQRQGSLRAPELPSITGVFRRNLSLRLDRNHSLAKETMRLSTSVHSDPIYESEEDSFGLGLNLKDEALIGLSDTCFNRTTKRVEVPRECPNSSVPFEKWLPQSSNQVSDTEKVRKQLENLKTVSVPSSGECTPTIDGTNFSLAFNSAVSSSRTKADEWLDDVLRVSMSLSPTSSQGQNDTLVTVSHSSGEPPVQSPPPLPAKQAVSKPNVPFVFERNDRFQPTQIDWSSSRLNENIQIQSKAVDPFDVQWSRLAVNNGNR